MCRVNERSTMSKKWLDGKNSRAPETIGKLTPSIYSDIDQYFKVYVTLVAHPGHFIVQPLNNTSELQVGNNFEFKHPISPFSEFN